MIRLPSVVIKLFVIFTLLSCVGTAAADAPTANDNDFAEGAKVDDLLSRSILPFHAPAERLLFLKLAGTDTEIDRAEFHDHDDAHRGFVRPFDQWGVLMRFDADRNQRINWLEAKEYRLACQTVILAHHDNNENGKLDQTERRSANIALHQGKLPLYFGISCCNETIDNTQLEKDSKKIKALLKKYELPSLHTPINQAKQRWEIGKKHALDHIREFEGIPETELMPMTSAPTADKIREILQPHYAAQLAEIVPESDWNDFIDYIAKTQKWTIDGDFEGLDASYDLLASYHMNKKKSPYPFPANIRDSMWQNTPPAYRFGFAASPIKVQTMRPIRMYDLETQERMDPQYVKELSKPMTVITIRMVYRTPHALYVRGSTLENFKSDRYHRGEMSAVYNPENHRGGPWYPTPNPPDIEANASFDFIQYFNETITNEDADEHSR